MSEFVNNDNKIENEAWFVNVIKVVYYINSEKMMRYN